MCTRMYINSVLICNTTTDLAKPLRFRSWKTMRLARLRYCSHHLRSSKPNQVAWCWRKHKDNVRNYMFRTKLDTGLKHVQRRLTRNLRAMQSVSNTISALSPVKETWTSSLRKPPTFFLPCMWTPRIYETKCLGWHTGYKWEIAGWLRGLLCFFTHNECCLG